MSDPNYARLPPPTPEQLRVEELEQALTTLTGHINAATCRFLILLGEFDRLGGWHQWGVASLSHWLSWRCGIGSCAAREKVRVARALPDLPMIRERFRRGEISYSKVRAMTRVATPANEAVLLQIARYGTAHHVEETVRKWRNVKRAEELQRAGKQHAVRSFHSYYDDDGCMVIRVKLPPEEGAVVREAIHAAMEELEEKAEVSYMVHPAFARAEREGRQGRMRSYIRPVVEARTPRAPMEIRHARSDQRYGLEGQETSQVACVPVRPVMPSNRALSVQLHCSC